MAKELSMDDLNRCIRTFKIEAQRTTRERINNSQIQVKLGDNVIYLRFEGVNDIVASEMVMIDNEFTLLYVEVVGQ